MADFQWGSLAVGDTTGSYGTVRLDPTASSPLHDFYVNKQLYAVGTESSGTITNYLGDLSWESTTGVSGVTIASGGSGCQSGGVLSSVGGGGDGFAGTFKVGMSLPSIAVTQGGSGCTGVVREDITLTIGAQGVVTAMALAATVTSTTYLSNANNPLGNQDVPAVITCRSPCSGTGLSAACTVVAGDVTAVTIVAGGTGYSSTFPPTVSCAEGYITAHDNSNGTGFANRRTEIISVATLSGSSSMGGVQTISLNGGTPGAIALDTAGVTGTSYQHNALAIIGCSPPCYGTGLVVKCYTDAVQTGDIYNGDGNLRKVAVITAGTGYSTLSPPTITCPEGGRNFLAFLSTTAAGAVDTVLVPPAYAGVGYGPGVQLVAAPTVPTCIAFVLTPALSGAIHTVTVTSNGRGYAAPPALTIASLGAGCVDFDLRAHIGDHTGSRLYAAGTALTATLGLSASKVENFYLGWTILMVGGGNAGQARRISAYSAGARLVTVDTAFGAATAAGDAYALTATPVRVLYDAARVPPVDFVGQASGVLPSLVAGDQNAVALAATASARDGYYAGQTIYFMAAAAAYSARITAYAGATRTATVSVDGTAVEGYDDSLPAATPLAAGTPYVISLSYIATVTLAPTAATAAGAAYTIRYQDFTAPELAHAQARPFFCDQLVGNNPPAAWIPTPFRKTFAFRSVPVICSAATLTIAAEGQPLGGDLWWQGNNFTLIGEHNEVLGTVFADSELYKTMEDGGPVYDTLALSQEKMIEMTADRDFVFEIASQKQGYGNVRFRYMKLSFHPAACFFGKVATDEYLVRDDHASGLPAVEYNLTIATPLGDAGAPASDGVVVVTADADLVGGRLELSYADALQARLFTDWVWGSGRTRYALSMPADVSTTCAGQGLYPAFSCAATDSVAHNGTRDGAHTAHHRIPRGTLAALAAGGGAALGFRVVNARAAKLSPVRLAYALLRCHMQSLSVGNGQLFGVSLFRPSLQTFFFPDDAPPAAGPAILWLKAVIKGHGIFNKQALGLPNQSPRFMPTDLGQYDPVTGRVRVQAQDVSARLADARDPDAAYQGGPRRYPYLSALGLHAGTQGELIGWMFNDDFSQYDVNEGYVDSIVIPHSIMRGFALTRRVELSLDVPPGHDTIRVLSAVLAYPA